MGKLARIALSLVLLLLLGLPKKSNAKMSEHKQGRSALGLADPSHIAYKQLSEASKLLDQSVQIVVVGDSMGIKAPVPVDALKDAIALIDDAIHNCPNDVDLLVAKASMLRTLSDSASAAKLLNMALSKDPNNFEALMATRNPRGWRYALNYPAWSENAFQIHPAMFGHLRLEHRVQLVRNGLQKTVAIVCKIEGPPLNKNVQTKLKWVLSETPYGPLVAWYLRIIEQEGEPSTMEAFLPIFQPTFNPMEGYCLIQQLYTNPYCFLVLLQGDRVVLNRKIVFSEKKCKEVSDIAIRLSAAKKYLPKDDFNKAIQWHMSNFRMDSLKFD